MAQVIDFKACSRCQGDMHVKQDMYGEYRVCLQCGYMLDVQRKPNRHEINEIVLAARRNAKGNRKVA